MLITQPALNTLKALRYDFALRYVFLFCLFLVACSSEPDQSPEQTSVTGAGTHENAAPEQIRWDLSDLYADDQAWEDEFNRLQKQIQYMKATSGAAIGDAEILAGVLNGMSSVRKDFYRLSVYANLLHDEDQRDLANQKRVEKVRALSTGFREAVAWLEPALLTIGESKVLSWLQDEAELSAFDFYLKDLFRNAPHRLDEQGESLLASAAALLSSPNQIYELLVNADVPWPTVELSNGDKVFLNQAGYSGNRGAANREDRKKVFNAFWSVWSGYQDSLGVILGTELQANLFQAKARNYKSVLQQQLGQENLPEEVYRTLVAEVNKGLPTLHRYFRLRARILGIEQMHYYDIYPPLVEYESDFSLEASKQITFVALKPLGKRYLQPLKRAIDANWAHVYPQEGKRSGAYMNGSAYDVHPYVLLNHNNDYNSLSTYAHEWGHAVHSLLANAKQPFTKAGYSTFTAEIASIINEVLLEEHLIARAGSKQEKLFYLGQALEAVRATFFRQTMFAEFELAIHEQVQRGEPITGARLSETYADLLKRYHDHEGGTLIIDDLYSMEWAYIPHFYYDFYVFQYATSMAGAIWFAEQLLEGRPGVQDAFIELLESGGADHAYSLLKKAGLDMAQPAPYEATVRRMEQIMDRIEALLAEE